MRPRHPVRRVAAVLAATFIAVPLLQANHPLPGPHRFTCEDDGEGDVTLSWDELGTTDAHRTLLYRNGSLLTELAPDALTWSELDVPPGIYEYRLDIELRETPEADPIVRERCEVRVEGIICEVFGGVAVAPQVDIVWILRTPGAAEILIHRDDELVAVLPGDANLWSEEPDGNLHTYRVDARYDDFIAIIGSCEVDYDPPVIGGFQRGDGKGDGDHDVSDAIVILRHLFLGGALDCEDAGDVDDNGRVEITDPIALLGHLFLDGAAPPAPYPDCGHDATEDGLGCEVHAPCFQPPPP